MSKTEIGKNGTEADHVARVEAAGGRSLKFVSPQRRGVPDRLDLYGVECTAGLVREFATAHGLRLTDQECCRYAIAFVAAAVQFTECKAPGKRPRPDQEREHKRLRAMGYQVNVYDG